MHRLIDYEYAGYNPVAYDVANHWCEYAADYHTQAPHVMDYSRLPDKALQLVFLRAYVNAVLALQQHMHPSVCTPCQSTPNRRKLKPPCTCSLPHGFDFIWASTCARKRLW